MIFNFRKISNESKILSLAAFGSIAFLISCVNKTPFTAPKAPGSQLPPAHSKNESEPPESDQNNKAPDSNKSEKSSDNSQMLAAPKIAVPKIADPKAPESLPKVPLLDCKVDMKGRYGGFALKGGGSLPFPEKIPEYPNSKLRLQFQAGSQLAYADSKLSAAKDVVAEKVENVSVSISDIPECDTKIVFKILPDNSFVVGSALERGLKGKLYQVPVNQSALPEYSKLKPLGDVFLSTVDVPVRSFSEGFPQVQDLKEWFSIDFRGFLVLTVEGDYQFKVDSDDGSKLFLNDKLVIENDGQHPVRSKSSQVMHLNQGKIPLNLPYFQGPANEIALQLFYKGPGLSEWTIVPQSMLRVD